MILQELLGIKSLKNHTAGQILKKIKSNGVKMVRGVYGIVLTHQDWDYVLKIFPKDDCYMHFLEFCKKNKSPHLPKIIKGPISMKPFFNDKNGMPVSQLIDKYYAVKIEKLEPFKDGSDASKAAYVFCNDFTLRDEYIESNRSSKVFNTYADAYKHEHGLDLKKHKALFDLIIKIYVSMDTSKCKSDIHPGNLMMRGDKIIVVDPYSAKEYTGMSLMKIISKMDLDELTK